MLRPIMLPQVTASRELAIITHAMSTPSHHPYWLLRRADQVAVAALVVVAMAAIAGWWIAHGGLSRQMVEIDQAESLTTSFQVDLNTADWPELVQLPGIGPTLAKRIVESRQKDGPFAKHDDLRRVRGIGPKKMESIRPYLLPMEKRSNVAGQ
jgi:competence protein ComEA